MENIFSKVEASNENALEMDGMKPLEPHIKSEGLENQESQEKQPITPEESVVKKEESDEQRSDSDDNDDVHLNQAASALEDRLANVEVFTSSSDVILPKPAPSENKKEKRRESKSRKELEEEEREKMQYVLNI
jgi:hypothetical protein